MSGGTFDYIDSRLKNEIFGFSGEFNNALEDIEISHLVWDILDLLHKFDWYKAGDTGEDSYLLAVAEFKRKWFGASRSKRLREYIDDLCYKVRSECLSLIGDDGDPASAYAKLLVDKYGDYVDKKTAAEIIGVTRQTVYAMIEDKRIQTGCRGKKVYVPSIADYMKARGDRRV